MKVTNTSSLQCLSAITHQRRIGFVAGAAGGFGAQTFSYRSLTVHYEHGIWLWCFPSPSSPSAADLESASRRAVSSKAHRRATSHNHDCSGPAARGVPAFADTCLRDLLKHSLLAVCCLDLLLRRISRVVTDGSQERFLAGNTVQSAAMESQWSHWRGIHAAFKSAVGNNSVNEASGCHWDGGQHALTSTSILARPRSECFSGRGLLAAYAR